MGVLTLVARHVRMIVTGVVGMDAKQLVKGLALVAANILVAIRISNKFLHLTMSVWNCPYLIV